MYKAKKLKKVLGDKLKENIVMRDYTTMKVGGVADYFFEAKNTEDLISAVLAAREDEIPFFVLGWASNVLISDYGYPGLMIVNKSQNISALPDTSQLIADSGVNLVKLVLYAINHNLGGLEKLFGIPGTVGGCIYGNAGAYGMEIFDFLHTVTMLSPNNKIISRPKSWFEPKYRSTILKRDKKRDYIILTAKFQLFQSKKKHMMHTISDIRSQRDDKFDQLGPSCGSIFKNPSSGRIYKNIELAKKHSAGYLLDSIDAKKMKVNGAGVYKKHSNIIENQNMANAKDVRLLIEKLRDKVRKNSGISLEEEIEYVGQWE
jgi:UDP-N-acetylmuramate dehydrogenase